MTTHVVPALPVLRAPNLQQWTALLAVVGGALVAGALLPWFTLFAGLQGYRGVTGLYGRLLLGGGVLVALAGMGLFFFKDSAVLRWGIGAVGSVLLAFSGWLMVGLLETYGELTANPFLVARLGPGLFVSLGGAALCAVILVLAYVSHTRQACSTVPLR